MKKSVLAVLALLALAASEPVKALPDIVVIGADNPRLLDYLDEAGEPSRPGQ